MDDLIRLVFVFFGSCGIILTGMYIYYLLYQKAKPEICNNKHDFGESIL